MGMVQLSDGEREAVAWPVITVVPCCSMAALFRNSCYIAKRISGVENGG